MPDRLQLLGSPTIDCDGRTIALPFERRTQMLVLLALRGGWVARAEVAGLLWPEPNSALAMTYLRKTLFRLRGLPWARCVQVQGGALRVETDTDLRHFEQALREQRLADALALHRGVLLAGFDDDANDAWTGWLHFERARVQSAWRAAALAHLEAGSAGPGADAAQALQLSAGLLEADPLDEAALRLHMALLAQAGQAPRARQAYRDFAARLLDELGITPGPALKALHDTLAGPAAEPNGGQARALDADGRPRSDARAGAAQAADFRPPADADGNPGFIGRAAERRQIHDALTGDSVRLLCITGPGGIGKTRLAQCATRDLSAAFADGVFFVALEDVGSSDELAQRIARELGLALAGREAPLAQLAQGLGQRQTLLVLDNFEQLVVDAAGALPTLLAACPRLRLLVTSRVRLGLATEQALPLDGLPCPEPEDIERFATFDATRLFVDAARRVEPALVPAAEAAAIAEICRQVDGLPLALELAAAWTRVLSCAAIAAELREGAALLQAQGTGHPARHASIEQVFEQSWQHLVPAERETLARLSVFHGGFTLDAARSVAHCALPVLGALTDKSLLRKEGQRLSLHPLVQQFAAARLTGSQRAATQAAHAQHFHRVLAQLGAGAERGERSALRAVDGELRNFLLALDWAVAQGQADITQQILAALCRFFEHRGRFEAGMRLLQQAIGSAQLQRHAALQTWLRAESAQFLYRLDRYDEAEVTAQAALLGAARSADTRLRLHALNVLAVCAMRRGRLAKARRQFQQVLALAAAHGPSRSAAGALDHLALVEKRLGNYDEALRLSLEALAQHRAGGEEARIALCLNNLATLYQARGNAAAAAAHLHEALAICERDGLGATLAFVLANLIEVTMAAGEEAEAERHAARALQVTEASANRAVHIWVQAQQGRLAVRRGDLATAAATLAGALAQARELALTHGYAPGLLGFAELLHASGDTLCGQRVLAIAAAHPSISPNESAELLEHLARWGGSVDTARSGMPEIGFDDLLHRIVVEAPDGHAALRALLRGASTTAAASTR